MRVALISAQLPSALDGIGDYTAHLAAELAKSHQVSVLCGMAEPLPIPAVNVCPAFDADHIRSVLYIPRELARIQPDWLLLQYCPFSFGRWGFNPYLPLALRRCRRVSPGTRIALTVHEPMAWPINWKLRTMNFWQGPQLRALSRASDLVVVVVGKWRERYARWFSGKTVRHLPVGSNIPLEDTTRQTARQRLGIPDETVVLGVFGQGHHSQRWDLAAAAAHRLSSHGVSALLLHLGPGTRDAHRVFAGLSVRSDGFLEAPEVSRRLSAVDIFLAPFEDGVSTRRTTVMAALQHGLPIVGTTGVATDEVFVNSEGVSLLLTRLDESEYVRAVERVSSQSGLQTVLRSGSRRLFEAEFSWPVIAQKLLGYLQEIKV